MIVVRGTEPKFPLLATAARSGAPILSVWQCLYGFGGGGSRSQWSTHFTVFTSTLAFLLPETSMSGRIRSVWLPLATLNVQWKLIDWTPRSLQPVWSRASV